MLTVKHPRWRRLLVVSLATCLFIAIMLHSLCRDYAWLMIALYRFNPPIRKGRCEPFPLHSTSAKERRLKFGIVMVFDDGMLDLPITRLSIDNKQAYAALHGYELLLLHGTVAVDSARPPAWSKFTNIRAHLGRFDYVFFVDVDTLITNLAIGLEQLVRPEGGDLILSEDWNGVNTGVFIIRNTPWSHWFLKEAWGGKGSVQEHMALHEVSAEGIPYPFEFEQRAVHYLLQTPKWRERGLPPYAKSASLWEHVELVPQCSINAYMLFPRPFWNTRARIAATWTPGYFIVHMAGHKGNNKLELFRYCANLAGSRMAGF